MITVVGEAIVDLVVSTSGDTVAHPGGSPANVAVGLGRLGSPVSLLTRFGRDHHGARLADHLAGSAVRLLGDPEDADPTSTALARTDASGAASYEFAVGWDLPEPLDPGILPAESVCLHTGSIAAVLEPGATTVRRLLEHARGRATVSYDPNCRPSLMGRPEEARARIEELVGLADVVKVSDEDLGWLYPERDHAAVAEEWLTLGPSLTVVTRGSAGSYGVCRAGAASCPGETVQVADTVGAGDAYMAGLLDALRRRDLLGPDAAGRLRLLGTAVLGELLDEASVVSAITCTRPGPNPPTAEEVAAYRRARRTAAADRPAAAHSPSSQLPEGVRAAVRPSPGG